MSGDDNFMTRKQAEGYAAAIRRYWYGLGYMIDIRAERIVEAGRRTMGWQLRSNLFNGLPKDFVAEQKGKRDNE